MIDQVIWARAIVPFLVYDWSYILTFCLLFPPITEIPCGRDRLCFPPIFLGTGLRLVKNEASKKSHSRNHVLSIAIAILFLISNFFILNSCSSSDGDNLKEEANTAHYYVKYEVSFSGIGSYYTHNVSIGYTSENGYSSVSQHALSWEGIFGPFKPGTTVEVSAFCDRVNGRGNNSARLSVCNGNGPFVLKAEYLGENSVFATYTIKETD